MSMRDWTWGPWVNNGSAIESVGHRSTLIAPPPSMTWWARGGGIARAGPFATPSDAANAIRLKSPTDEELKQGRRANGYGLEQEFPPDAFVWPESA